MTKQTLFDATLPRPEQHTLVLQKIPYIRIPESECFCFSIFCFPNHSIILKRRQEDICKHDINYLTDGFGGNCRVLNA